MKKVLENEVEVLRSKLAEKEEHVRRLVGENITLVTENMKLAYDAKRLRKRLEFLEIFDKGYALRSMAESKGEYMVVLMKKGEFSGKN